MTQEQFLKNLEVPKGRIDVILDSDTFNEADDQFAMGLMLHSPEKFNIVGFTAVPFFNANSVGPADGMEKSYHEMHHILELDGKEHLKDLVYRGSLDYLPDEKTPVESEAARFIAGKAKEYSPEHPLYVVAIGAGSNVASAILMEREAMVENTVVVWLSGHAKDWPDAATEFNMTQDIAAARVIFGCGVPLVQLPCMGVVSAFTVSKPEMELYLKGKGALADYVTSFTINDTEKYLRRKGREGEPWARCIWDVTAVGWLLNEDGHLMRSYLIPAPIPQYDKTYSFDPRRHPIRYVYHIERDRLCAELVNKLTNGL